jgi:hypothetical protein
MNNGNIRMKKNTPFTKHVAAALALLVLRASVCGAASLAPGSLAILECTLPDHEMRAAWEEASREARTDPLLLVLNEDEVYSILEEWRTVGDAVDAAWWTADKAALERVQSMLDEAWGAYYAFSFEKALGILREAEELLALPGDSRFRSRLAFEVNILQGMVYRAGGDGNYWDEFKKAAAVFPDVKLSPDRYSPEIISVYKSVREELLSDGTVLVAIDAKPADADILMDGKITDSEQGEARLRIFPGRHFVEARAAGYEPFSYVLEVGEWDSPSLRFNLIQSGPEGESDRFFLERLRAGDRLYLSRLLEKLGVDYVLIPGGEGGALHPWLVGRDGRAAAHRTIWEPGADPGSAVTNLSDMLHPLRHDREEVGRSTLAQLNLPPPPGTILTIPETPEQAAGWKRYAAVLGILVLVAVAAASDSGSGGGTTVEVTW